MPGRDGIPGSNGIVGPPGHVFIIPVSRQMTSKRIYLFHQNTRLCHTDKLLIEVDRRKRYPILQLIRSITYGGAIDRITS